MGTYETKESILERAGLAIDKSIRDFIPVEELPIIEAKVAELKNKGYLGNLVEWFVFGKKADSLSQADFHIADIELKTTPIKHSTKHTYVAKERLVFSMIDYQAIRYETWETSSFLKKNKVILLMFYLWMQSQTVLDYKFKFVHLLDLLGDLSDEDVLQIQKDWEFIVAKIGRNEAHLLSEGDTYYLGACTKAANSRVVREQSPGHVPAKPRAFSLKQQYINYLIQTKLLHRTVDGDSIFKKSKKAKTVEEAVNAKFAPYFGQTDTEILKKLETNIGKTAKSYKRLVVNKILGVDSDNILELEKANITLRVITLESNGTLKESISFPAFDFKDLVTQTWYDDKEEVMSDFHLQLETKKFLFVVFQKQENTDDIVLRKTMFWNFPMQDIDKAKEVWEMTITLINEGKIVREIKKNKRGEEIRYTHFPGSSFNGVAHVRPHGSTREDMIELPVADELTGMKEYTKQCFWLNASYIQHAIEKDQD
ncbi:DNA mismatch repair protein [Candidatus Kaiserbacteria bacterium]|nr:MAG: DNA mismatch repair protein [Candidatus Kaiserbacteria bacterium]